MNVNKNQSETPIVIGIDHGYGNIKTASSCFRTSVKAYDTEPTFTSNMLVYNGRYYIIGEGHKEFIPEKQNDDDYYILTLAAVGRELYARNLESASVYLAAGLPLTWVSEQKDEFKAYLLREPHVDFVFKKRNFHVDFVGADIFPQGFAAVAGQLGTFRGVNMICDIGNGTMNVMYITDCRLIGRIFIKINPPSKILSVKIFKPSIKTALFPMVLAYLKSYNTLIKRTGQERRPLSAKSLPTNCLQNSARQLHWQVLPLYE